MNQAKILLLEDDNELGSTIVEILEDADYEVDLASDGAEAAELTYENSYDMYIFDINVPEINGIELLKDLRNADDNTPTIYITALVDLDSISKAFDAGAEGYIKKPFMPEELLIRVDAKLKQMNRDSIKHNGIEYFPSTKEVFLNNKIISLGSVQLKVFDALMRNLGKTVIKEDLLELLEQPSESALRVTITKIKQKLGIEIKNIRGLGYIIEKV
jgi:DNA-binding response OmpR family regulator